MKNRSLISSGVFLCTVLAPMALPRKEEEQDIELFIKPPQVTFLDWVELQAFDEFLEPFDVKPISYFLRKNIPLCTVSTAPYGRDTVHKPPWFER